MHGPVQLEEDRPVVEPKRPAKHNPEHAAAVIALALPYLPAAQFKQIVAEACAVSALYLPAAQLTQSETEVCAVSSLYFPAGHSFSLSLVEAAPHQCPALHGPVQVATVLASELPYLPGGQSRQATDEVRAVRVLYLPAGHAVCVLAPGPHQ